MVAAVLRPLTCRLLSTSPLMPPPIPANYCMQTTVNASSLAHRIRGPASVTLLLQQALSALGVSGENKL